MDDLHEKLRTAIYTAIGGASMCWDPSPKEGAVFDATRAKDIADKLLKEIEELTIGPMFDMEVKELLK